MRVVTIMMAAAALAACSGKGSDAAEERRQIDEAYDRWIVAYETGDAEGVANLFTADAVYAANTGQVLNGRNEIRTGVAAWIQGASRVGERRRQARLDLERESQRLVQQGPFAHDLSRFTIRMDPPGCVVDTGQALAVWERQDDGRWLIDALAVNQDPQPPGNACRNPG